MQLYDLKSARILLILPCNAAACIGDYFRAETYTKKGWNTWKEADTCLSDLRSKKLVAFAAMDSSTLDTEPIGSKGAIVFETEMNRAKNPTGKDWGAPNWRWFKPTRSGKCEYLESLTESLVKGIRRVEKMKFSKVFALVNPRGYFLSLAAAVDRCGLLNEWTLFRVPSHPRHLLSAVRQITPFVCAAAEGNKVKGGIYSIPELYPFLKKEADMYKDFLPKPWQKYSILPDIHGIKMQWLVLTDVLKKNNQEELMIKNNEKTFLGINLSGNLEKANYLARIFAPFYEKLLEAWLETKGFESKGRPTVYNKNGKYRTYDYTLGKNGKSYIVEAKCWLAFNNSDYLELTESLIKEWGDKDNFMFFCNLGTKREPYKKYTFYYTNSDKDFTPNGKILFWPKIRKDEAEKIKKIYKFYDIFSIEDAINDMKNQSKKSGKYFKLTSKYRTWTEELFRAISK